jgi:hypothetical protein
MRRVGLVIVAALLLGGAHAAPALAAPCALVLFSARGSRRKKMRLRAGDIA